MSEEIAARPLKPELYRLNGISRVSVEAHYRLYQGYVAKRNEIVARCCGRPTPGAANQVYSEYRSLKLDLTFALGAIKNHEVYFEHLGGAGGEPDGAIGRLIDRDFGSAGAWRADLAATAIAARGWAWTAYDWDERRLFNFLGDSQNTFPVWNATPARRARRARARLLHGLPDRPRLVRRGVLREPRLGRRQRLGGGVRDPVVRTA